MPRYGNIDKIQQRETRSQVYEGGAAIGVAIRDLSFLDDYASPEDSHLVTGPQLERLETHIRAISNILDGCKDVEWGLCQLHKHEVQHIVVAINALLAQIREKQ